MVEAEFKLRESNFRQSKPLILTTPHPLHWQSWFVCLGIWLPLRGCGSAKPCILSYPVGSTCHIAGGVLCYAGVLA